MAEKLSTRTGLLGGSKTNELREQAIQMISEGKGNELLLLPGWWYVTTANSYIDRLTTMPNTVQTAPKIKCPSLFIRGDLEIPEELIAPDSKILVLGGSLPFYRDCTGLVLSVPGICEKFCGISGDAVIHSGDMFLAKNNGCQVKFEVDFQFRSFILHNLINKFDYFLQVYSIMPELI